MTAYERLLAEALGDVEAKLVQKGVPKVGATQLIDLLRQVNFPGLLGLLGTSAPPGGELGQALLHEAATRAAQRPELTRLHVSAGEIEEVLTAVFEQGASPDTMLHDAALRDSLLEAAVHELSKRAGMVLTPEEAAEAIRLMATGQFFGDVAAATAAIVFAVPGLPLRLLADVRSFPLRSGRLLLAVVADLEGSPLLAVRVLADLLADGKLDHPPKVLTRTMTALYGFSTLASTAETIRELIGPDNQSVRLAIVVYARAHGIPLEEEDLDTVRENVFNTASPDLGPPLAAALARYVDTRGAGRLREVLQGIAIGSHLTPPAA